MPRNYTVFGGKVAQSTATAPAMPSRPQCVQVAASDRHVRADMNNNCLYNLAHLPLVAPSVASAITAGRSPRGPVAAALAAVLALGAAALPARAWAQAASTTATAAVEAPPKKKPSADFPLSGSVRANPSFGGGSFVTGPGSRPSGDMIFGYSLRYAIMPGLAVSVSELLIKNMFSNADSGASRPYDSTVGDMLIGLSWTPQVKNAKGENEPFLLPGKIRPGFALGSALGLSRGSRYSGRYGGIGPSVSLSRADLFDGVLSLSGSFGATKYFNRSVSAAVPAADNTVLARPNGAEVIANGYVLTGQNVTSHALRTVLSANVAIGKRVNIFATYILFNNFREYVAPDDGFSSVNSQGPGRQRANDSQWGIFGASYNLDADGHLVTSVSTFVVSPPFSADNKTWRFPFWDFRSTSDNYATIGAELSYSF